jgi:signal transduction histidine kinase
MDGYELAEILRGDEKTREVPIMFLTAASSADEQVFKGYEAGAVDYIVKPYNPAIVLSKVRVFLAMHRQKAELERHREQLTAVNAELEAFAYSVSHDLRAPLRAIGGFSQALLEDCPEKLNEQERDFLNRIANEAGRMDQLIRDLLALSKVTRAEMRYAEVDIGGLANEVVDRLRASEPSRSVEVLVSDGLSAFGDARLLQVALENLVSNAWKFTGRRQDARIEVGEAAPLTRNRPPLLTRSRPGSEHGSGSRCAADDGGLTGSVAA